jgi:hypothetical protein
MSQEADRTLLQRFEPVIRYTRGERFFPIDVDSYVRESSLWVQRPGQEAKCLVPEGELNLYKLAEPRLDGFGAVYFIKFIEPMNIAELATFRIKEMRDQLAEGARGYFRAGKGRLARVGYLSRLVDAVFSITLLARGRISGDTAAAAAMTYARMLAERERYVYYGRVVRQDHWTALQYWFFYPFNSWRSGFFGVNDHEADWEMVCVYLAEPGPGSANGHAEPTPEWVAYASHDFAGDDLRRRWDDPVLEKVAGTHPVIYAGAGSHASYYEHGEYLTEIEIPFLAPLVKTANQVQALWARLLKQATNRDQERHTDVTFRVPFVDYARGDGLSVGPGQAHPWEEPCLLNPTPGWALSYRGLWGVYVRDPISGENAPAGPLYNRDGSVRRPWYDPVGWAGLDKVPPPDEELALLRQRQLEIAERQDALRAAIAEKDAALMALGVETEALATQPHLKHLHAGMQAQLASLSDEIARLRAQAAEDETRIEALSLHAARVEAGERCPPDAHLRHPHRPASSADMRLGRLAEGWAAVSVGLLMLSLVALVIMAQQYLALGIVVLIALVLAIESTFRRRLYLFITRLTIALAVASAVILLYEFFWTIVVAVVLIAGVYLTIDNLRELWK